MIESGKSDRCQITLSKWYSNGIPAVLSRLKAFDQIHRTAVLVRVPQHLEVDSTVAGEAVPRAAVLVRVPQHLEVPVESSIVAGASVPWTAMLVRVPQRLELPTIRRCVGSVSVPWAAARVEPGQRAQLPLPRSDIAHPYCERALPVLDQLLEGAHAAEGSNDAEHAKQVQHEASHVLPREHGERARVEEA
eukprot:CAMPEP_0179846138 /NCGR_PEP_ID=MMETSP0982-20121206/5393_1 /TAXON_ID=483367 /ORGANISM="non described non described, Strain CCMP 2436" /LENGTH=190 /DNA_ID=CAMNT_0021731243 /DNA_START=67 /DNA_END=640 /DNA_ORIENTATION=-